jgi:hypothetical protein
MTSSHFNSVAHFRSSNEASSGSLGEHDRFQFRPHDSTLEQTADSQEQDIEDATLKDLPKPSPPSKKSTAEPDLILVSSSGKPSGSKRHVSSNLLSLCIKCYLSAAPEGESKCVHLGQPSKKNLQNLSLLPLDQHVVRELSKVCKNYIALEEENQRLSTALEDMRCKWCLLPFVYLEFFARQLSLIAPFVAHRVNRNCCSSRC